MVGSKVMTLESMLMCFSRFSQYLNCFNSDFDPWIVIWMRIWLYLQMHWSQPVLTTGLKLRFLGPTRSQLRVKLAKNLRGTQVWYKTMKNVVLWGFWPCSTFDQTWVDQGHFSWNSHFGRPSVQTGCATSFWMFSWPHEEKITFLDFSRFGTQIEARQNTVSTHGIPKSPSI